MGGGGRGKKWGILLFGYVSYKILRWSCLKRIFFLERGGTNLLWTGSYRFLLKVRLA